MHFRFLIAWYDKVLAWSKHPRAPWYLGLISFVDASVFPISPLFMLLPMSFANPRRSFHFALIAIISSFIGGMVGYALGFFAFEVFINPFINWMGYVGYYQMALQWFQTWGFWAILIGCLSPIIPYKIFTISAGVMQLDFGWFLVASIIGRSLRFLLIAAFICWGGPKVAPLLRKTLVKITDYQS